MAVENVRVWLANGTEVTFKAAQCHHINAIGIGPKNMIRDAEGLLTFTDAAGGTIAWFRNSQLAGFHMGPVVENPPDDE